MTTTQERRRSEDAAVAAALAASLGFGSAFHMGSADVRDWEPHAKTVLEPVVRRDGSWGAWLAGALSAASARRVMEGLILRGRSVLAAAAERAKSDAAKVPDWLRAMGLGVFVNHTAAALAAKGGKGLDDDDRLDVAGRIMTQAEYLRRYRWQVQTGQAEPEPHRSSLYADALWATGMAVWLAAKAREGLTQARRILGGRQHCPDCLSLAALGWVPIGSMTPIGSTRCASRCHCHYEMR